MKNIHILPTEESTLWFYKGIKDFLLTGLTVNKSTSIDPRHIYITSDEEIKKDEYYLGDDNHIYNLVTSVNNNGKKIVLTTDPTLIADGVQVIDDEFLKWFVKNPSCEFVEVNKKLVEFPLTFKMMYKIIILQEEAKQDLEKAAEKYSRGWGENDDVKSFIAGAKWQAERMYSEEDLRRAYTVGKHGGVNQTYYDFDEWLEQNKKK